jgi:hypothetical protein
MKTKIRGLKGKELIEGIIKLAEEKGLKPYRSYSGRGMFGRKCMGFYGDKDTCSSLANYIKRNVSCGYDYDNFGMDMIYYFPAIEDNND